MLDLSRKPDALGATGTPTDGEITEALKACRGGDPTAIRELMPIVYGELCRIASRHLRQERQDHTLQTSGLVHEAFIRLSEQKKWAFEDRGQFFGLAAHIMRRVLVDHARRVRSSKRGGEFLKLSLDDVWELPAERARKFIALDDALCQLARLDPEQAAVVEMRFFGGFTNEEIARTMNLSLTSIRRRWRAARAWLNVQLEVGDDDESGALDAHTRALPSSPGDGPGTAGQLSG